VPRGAKRTRRKLPPLYIPRRFNAVTRSRFFFDRKREYLKQLGHSPSTSELVNLHRAIEMEWVSLRAAGRLNRDGELPEGPARAWLAAENRMRLDLKALGFELKGTAHEKPVVDYRRRPRQEAEVE
jgi:hypothetical protein